LAARRARSTVAASKTSAAARIPACLALNAGTGAAQVRLTNRMVVVFASIENGALEPVQTSPPLLLDVTLVV
jgi:hypothetical protein